jgi:hypothetical protein
MTESGGLAFEKKTDLFIYEGVYFEKDIPQYIELSLL